VRRLDAPPVRKISTEHRARIGRAGRQAGPSNSGVEPTARQEISAEKMSEDQRLTRIGFSFSILCFPSSLL
jgi:hypothetical protein